MNGIDEQGKLLIAEAVERWEQEGVQLEVMLDPVHLLVGCDPSCGIHRLVKFVKGATFHALCREFLELKKNIPNMWTKSSSVGTTDDVTIETGKRDVEGQKGKMCVSQTKRAYKFRFSPTDEQAHLLAHTFGCVRFVYNWALHTRSTAYKEQGKKLSYNDLSAMLPALKDQFSWLKDVSSVPVQQCLRHLDKAFKNFFEGRAKYPAFKKKHHAQSATYASNAFTWDGTALTLAKMDALLDIVWSRPLPDGCKPTTVTIMKDGAGRYFVSLLIEEDITPLPVVKQMVGLDLGLKSMVILSTGEAVGNPRFLRQDEKKLAKAQRRQAKKKKGSRNRNKARLKVARVHARITDCRRDYQHKLSTRIVRENQVICVESLAVKNMVKNHCLARSISDVGWGEFVRQLEYKAKWYGRTLVKIDRWYPSSKTCHNCKYVLDELDLQVRSWVCPQCRTVHDRDTNAAKNILAEGLSVTACGGGVRPGRRESALGNPQ